MKQKQIFCNGFIKNGSGNDILTGIVVYEVIRIINGKPLFLQEHLQRLKNSAKMRLPNQPPMDDIIKGIHSVIETNCLENGNIEIQINDNQQLIVKIIPHSYPSETMYRQGVCTGLLKAERTNPNAKEKNQTLRDCANKLIKENGFFEVLLVNHQGFITEGSRSNVFFVKENQVVTSPTMDVLQGITREKIFDICHQNNIQIKEETISLSNLTNFDAAFMTGTSPAVLPIQKIEKQQFNPNNILTEKIKNLYNLLVESDLKQFQWVS